MYQQENTRHPFEPTKEELPVPNPHSFSLDRRKFFKFFGGGLAVAILSRDLLSFAAGSAEGIAPNQVGAWIHINEEGVVSVYTGKVEVGQNIRTSLAQIVAEELHVAVSSIEMIMGDTDLVPYDAGTFGSRSTPQMGTQLRSAAATAREALLQMAAKEFKTEAKGLTAEAGVIKDAASKREIKYGALTKGQQLLLPIAKDAATTPASEWKVAGHSVLKVNGATFITGRHKYVSDMKLPGMLYGKVLRPPSYEASLLEADVSKAAAMFGVIVVRDGDFIAVAAPGLLLAEKALAAIQARWEQRQQPSRKEIFRYLVDNATEGGGGRNGNDIKGDLQKEFASSDLTLEKKYTINYIAHVPLEPRAALAEWKDGKLTVFTGTQRPFGVQQDLADLFRMSKENIRVIVPDTGSGYGGKHSAEAAEEAARIAKETKRPVKLVWTREEESTWAYFRPGGVIEVKSGFQKDGTINAWKFINYNSGGSGLTSQYKSNSREIRHIPSKTPLKQGSYRGLAATANIFARESHITDMARMAKISQLEYRMNFLDDTRLKNAVAVAAGRFRWSADKPFGHGYGIACGFEKGGYVATCAEVLVNGNKEVKILRVVQAFECGAIVNPLHLHNQVIGSIVQGLGGALFEAVDFTNGKIVNAKLSRYRVPRFRDVPEIDIVLCNRQDLPSAGAGEAAILTIAPAIRNAILDATGIALYSLPLIPEGRVPEEGKSA